MHTNQPAVNSEDCGSTAAMTSDYLILVKRLVHISEHLCNEEPA